MLAKLMHSILLDVAPDPAPIVVEGLSTGVIVAIVAGVVVVAAVAVILIVRAVRKSRK